MAVKVSPLKKQKRKKKLGGGRRSGKNLDYSELMDTLDLPEKAAMPGEKFEDYTMLIYGERKIGKTSLLAQFKKPFFFMFDPEAVAVKVKQRYCPTWTHFQVYIEKLRKKLEKNPDYCRTVVIDTGYMAYERCWDWCVNEMGIEDPRDKSWATGWKFIEREFRRVHNDLFDLGLSFQVTAHSDIREKQTKSGEKYDRITAQLGGQAHKFYMSPANVVAYFHYNDDGKRVLALKGSADLDAGNQISGHFLYKGTNKPVREIPMGKSPEQAYDNLINAFNNKLEKPSKKGGNGGKRLKRKVKRK